MMMYLFFSGLKKEKLIFYLLLLINLHSFSQNKSGTTRDETSFSLYTDSVKQSYIKDRPYYLVSLKKEIPENVKIIRRINENTGIIKISTKEEFDLIKKQLFIAAATKLIPSIAALFICLYYKGTPPIALKIWNSWVPIQFPTQSDDIYSIPASIDGIRWTLQEGF